MKLLEMKKKVLALIEELNTDAAKLTDDPDIEAKLLEVMNQVMFELVRIKKNPKYVEVSVKKGETLTFEDISDKVGYDVYQINCVDGVRFQYKAGGTVLKILEDGVAEIDCFVYPKRLTEETKDDYELELSAEVLEIMPYGVAADLLKSDVSTEYGSVYATRFEQMLERLDPRYQMGHICVEGGVDWL